MKVKKGILPIFGFLLMILLTAGDAYLILQATGDPYYLLLSLMALPLFIAIIFVLFFRLDDETPAL